MLTKTEKEALLEALRWLGQDHIELKTAVIGLKGLLIDKEVLTPEEIEEWLRVSHEQHFAAAQQAGISAFEHLEELLRKI